MLELKLSEQEEQKLSSISSVINYPKGQIIFTAGQRTNEVYYIKSGWVRIYRTVSDGRQVTVALRYAGDFIGLAEIFNGSERECSAEAMDDVSIHVIYGYEFRKLLSEDQEFNLKIMSLLGDRLREAQNTIHDFISNQVQGRLASVFKHMAERSGIQAEGDIINIDIKITQAELACMVGAARQTISSIMSLFKEQGCIISDGRGITGLNIKKLDTWIE